MEAGVDAEHREHWGDGRNADARHSERLKSATSWRVQSTLEVRRMWTVPICVQGGEGKGKLSRAIGGMGDRARHGEYLTPRGDAGKATRDKE